MRTRHFAVGGLLLLILALAIYAMVARTLNAAETYSFKTKVPLNHCEQRFSVEY